MRNSILFIAILLVSAVSGAQSKPDAAPPTLTYEEFRQLSEADRAAYIEDLQRFVLKMERAQDAKFEARAGDLWRAVLGEDAFAAPGDTCVYAGYLSTVNSRGYCSPPAARSWSYGGQSRSYCTGAGQTLCNPMMYGFGPGGNGICTSSRTNPTLDCDSQYRKIPNYGGAQISKQLADSGLDKEFNAQAEKLTGHCSTPGVKQASLCKYLSERSSYMKKKLEAERKKKEQERKGREEKERQARAAATGPNATASAETPRPQTPPTTQAPTPAPTPPNPVPTPLSRPTQTQSAPPTNGAETPAVPPSPPATAAPAVKPETKPDEATASQAKPKPKDNCIRSKDDFEHFKDKLPAKLHGLALGKKACVVLPPQLGGIVKVPGVVEMQLQGNVLKVGTYIDASGWGREYIAKESFSKEICVTPKGLKLTFTDKEVKQVGFAPDGLIFYDPKDGKGTQFNFEDNVSKCNAIKDQVRSARPQGTGGRQ